MTRRILSAIVFSVLCAAVVFAQPTESGTTAAIAKKSPPIPFQVGETLVYEGKLSKIINVSVAELTMKFEAATEGSRDYIIKAEARSKGTLLKIARFSFLQTIDSTVDQNLERSFSTVKHDTQKERVRNSEALFDYDRNRVTYTETDPKEPTRPPRKIASELPGPTHDIISGIYNLRTLPLAVGKTFELTISDSGLVYQIPVKVARRERQKTAIGRVWCYVIEADVFGPGRLIEREGSMSIWITDDAKKIPVRATVNTSFGKVEIKLKSATAPK